MQAISSTLSPLGYQAGSCGYCKGDYTSCSYYVKSKHLHVNHYQKLVDRGWRRSGSLLYKPDPRYSCCPHYTIRLPAAEFKPRKDQKQVLNRWNKFVLGDEYHKKAAERYPKSKADKIDRQRNGFDLLSAVHEAEKDALKAPIEPAHDFTVTLEADTYTAEKYALFKAYQEHVHHDNDCSPSGFQRFLCTTPLNRTTLTTSDGTEKRLGSYHQLYRLDGRLIALAALDLLPHCVSGVYFIYHPDFEKWSFGKISALREIALAIEGGYDYYYMGYYIHSCAKMRYKNDYRPQHFLDFENGGWDPLDDRAMGLMEKQKYVSLSREARLQDGAQPNDAEGHKEPTEDEAEPPAFANAAEATKAYNTGTSLFAIGLPGMLTAEEVAAQTNVDEILINVPRRTQSVHAKYLVGWANGDLEDAQSFKGVIGELVACIGADLAGEIVVDFGG